MANEIWRKEEKKFLNAVKKVRTPNSSLIDVPSIVLKEISDVEKISEGGGCYWIWTNEPVLHSLHKNPTPQPFKKGEIIYNGIAKDDVRGRIKHHLFGEVDAGWSGISLDIYFGNTISHRKKALSEKGKVPFIKIDLSDQDDFTPIRRKEYLMKIHLSANEKNFLKKTKKTSIYFRNGIDVRERKHSKFEFRVYFITGLSSLYLDFIEKKWREDYGLPKLCSYSSGR